MLPQEQVLLCIKHTHSHTYPFMHMHNPHTHTHRGKGSRTTWKSCPMAEANKRLAVYSADWGLSNIGAGKLRCAFLHPKPYQLKYTLTIVHKQLFNYKNRYIPPSHATGVVVSPTCACRLLAHSKQTLYHSPWTLYHSPKLKFWMWYLKTEGRCLSSSEHHTPVRL